MPATFCPLLTHAQEGRLGGAWALTTAKHCHRCTLPHAESVVCFLPMHFSSSNHCIYITLKWLVFIVPKEGLKQRKHFEWHSLCSGDGGWMKHRGCVVKGGQEVTCGMNACISIWSVAALGFVVSRTAPLCRDIGRLPSANFCFLISSRLYLIDFIN